MPSRPTAHPAQPLVALCLVVLTLCLTLAAPPPASAATTRSFNPVRSGTHVLVFRVDGVRPGLVRSARLRIGRRVRPLRTHRVRRSLRDHVLRVPVLTRRSRGSVRRVRRVARKSRLVIRMRGSAGRRRFRPRPISGASYYVSPAGSDQADGSAPAPWRTVAHAAGVAGPGSTVVLEPGTYAGQGEITRLGRDGAPGSPVTFTGRPGAAAPRILGQLRIDGAYVRVNRVLLDGPTGQVAATGGDNPGGEDVKLWIRGDHAELTNSEVRGSLWHAGIYVSDAEEVRIAGNYVHHNGDFDDPSQSNLDHGIYWSSGSGAVVGNRIEHNYAYGVHLYPEAQHVLVTQNEITGHGRGGVIVAERAAYNVIAANEITRNREGIKTYALSGDGNVARDNRVWGNWEANFGETSGLELQGNRGSG